MSQDQDQQAPGAAITEALCGSTQHEPPCPLAPHHTAIQRAGDQLRLRVLFAAEPEAVPEVRRHIDEALVGGSHTATGGARATWRLLESGASLPRPDEQDHGRRLIKS